MPQTSPFEMRLVHILNDFFEHTKQPGIAYRLKQSRFYTQFLDIIVDSSNKAHYLGIECKSLHKDADRLYFSAYFSTDKKGVSQIQRISNYLEKSCRYGVLAVEIRSGSGPKPHEVYLIPFFHVQRAFEDGKKAMGIKEMIQQYPRLIKTNATWNVDVAISALRQF